MATEQLTAGLLAICTRRLRKMIDEQFEGIRKGPGESVQPSVSVNAPSKGPNNDNSQAEIPRRR